VPVTQTLNESLGTLPSGRVVELSDDLMTRHLRTNYLENDAEVQRRARMARRIDFYRDRCRHHINAMLDDIFRNAKVKEWRKRFVPYAGFQNISMRVTRETSSVYSEPALRTVKTDPAKNYSKLQRRARMDRRMRHVNRLGNLTNNVLIWPDVRNGDPKLHVVTQDHFWAIADPNDPTTAVGYVIDKKPRGVVPVHSTGPHYLGIDGQTFFRLDSHFRLIEGSRYPHNVGRLPVVLYSREESEESILDAHSGEDLIDAHLSIALLNILMLKAQKAGTRQPVFSGDLSTTPLDQAMDEESALQLGEGVTAQTLDLTADPETYIKAGRAVIKQIAANRGIPESVFDLSYQATSGFEIELKRAGLMEVRHDQMLDFQMVEEELVEVNAAVLSAARHPLAFDPEGFAIDFGEIEIQDPSSRLDYYAKAEGLDLMTREEMLQRMEPETDADEIKRRIAFNRHQRLMLMVEFQKKNAGAFGPGNVQQPGRAQDSTMDDEEEDENMEAMQ
jgi:hypothetical protein